MNWYYYWFYAIYSIYKRLSWDRHFDVFAIGMFSVIISFWVINILNIVLLLLETPESFYGNNKYVLIIIGAPIFILNWVLFLPKAKQLKLYEDFKLEQNPIKNFFAVFFSLLSVVIFLYTIIQIRKYFVI